MDALNHIEITVHPTRIKSTLRALLQAIFFHRLLDPIDPETVEVQDTHVAACSNASVDKDVNSRIEEFYREYVDKGAISGECSSNGDLERDGSQSPRSAEDAEPSGQPADRQELIPWEEHLITLHFPPVRYGTASPPNPLPSALLQLLTFCAQKKNNVPPLSGTDGASNVSHQILVAPPPPAELFSPSPPLNPSRLTSPPPVASTTTTAATAMARDLTMPPGSALNEAMEARDPSRDARRASSPGAAGERGGAMGYFEQAKDGLRAVGARAGAVTGWTGRGGTARPY